LILIWEVSFQFDDEWGKTLLHGRPENGSIDVEIGVNETMAHTDDLVPGDAGHLCPGVRTQLGRRLPDDLDSLNQCPLELAILIEVLTAAMLHKADGLSRCIEHMPKPYLVILPHTAPRLLP
jgi:hypothetical protein